MQQLVCFILIIGINFVAAGRNSCGEKATYKNNWPGNEQHCDYGIYPVTGSSKTMPRNSSLFSYMRSLNYAEYHRFLELNDKNTYSGCGCNDGYWRDWQQNCVTPINCYSLGFPTPLYVRQPKPIIRRTKP